MESSKSKYKYSGSAFDNEITATAEKYGLDRDKFWAQIKQESAFKHQVVNKKSGAIGLGQIMPDTAKLFGVKDTSQLYDPNFNLDLAAKIMKENLGICKGDYNCALAQYNGSTATRKLYQKGLYDQMPKETIDYINKLGDEKRWGTGKYYIKGKGHVEDLTTMKPYARPESKTVPPSNTPKLPEVPKVQPTETPANNTGTDYRDISYRYPELAVYQTTKTPVNEGKIADIINVEKLYRKQLGGMNYRSIRWADDQSAFDPSATDTPNVDVGFFGGMYNSWAVLQARLALSDGSILGENYDFTDDEHAQICRDLNWNANAIMSVERGATSMKDAQERIKIMKENWTYKEAEAKAGFFSSLMSGIGGGVTDPLSYIPAFGQLGFAGRVLSGAALGAVSNQIDTYISGTEHDILTDMVVGAAFGGLFEVGLHGAGKSVKYIGDSGARAKLIREAQVAGKDLPSEMFNGLGGSTKLAKTMVRLEENLHEKVPVISQIGVVRKLASQEAKDFYNKIFMDRGVGQLDETGHRVATTHAGRTVEEILRDARIDYENYHDKTSSNFNKLRQLGFNEEEINDSFYNACEGGKVDPRLQNTPEFQEMVKDTQEYLAKFSTTGQVGGYFPRVSDSVKVSDLFNPELPRDVQVKNLVDEMASTLTEGVNTNPQKRQEVLDHYKKHVWSKLQAEQQKRVDTFKEKKDKEKDRISKSVNRKISDKAVEINERKQRYQDIRDDAKDTLDKEVEDFEKASQKKSEDITQWTNDEYVKLTSEYNKKKAEETKRHDKKLQDIKDDYKDLLRREAQKEKKYEKDYEIAERNIEANYRLNIAKAKTLKGRERAEKWHDEALERIKKVKENKLKALKRNYGPKKFRNIGKQAEAKTAKKTALKDLETNYQKATDDLSVREKAKRDSYDEWVKKKEDKFLERYKDMDERLQRKLKAAQDSLSKTMSEQHKRLNDLMRRRKFDDEPMPLPEDPPEDVFQEWLEIEARNDSMGYIDQGTSTGRGIINESNLDAVVYDPDMPRIPWDTSRVSVRGVSVNKLRRNPLDSIRMYHDKMVGDMIVKSLGCETKSELKEKIGKILVNEFNTSTGKNKLTQKDLNRLLDFTMDMIYNKQNHARSDINGSWVAALADAIRNFTFFSKNALMGVANLFEQAEAVKHYGAMQFLRGVPMVRDLCNNWTKNGMTHKEVRQAQAFIFGHSVRQMGVFRDIASESWDRQLRRFNGNKAKAMLVAGTDILAQASPFTKFLQKTENSIVEANQGMFLGELIQFAHDKRLSKRGFLTKETMLRNGISEENFNRLLDNLRINTSYDKKTGAMKVINLQGILADDPAALATLRRLGDYVAHEVIQKNTLGDAFLWEGANRNPFVQLLFQFKSFAIRSYDKRIRKMLGRAAEGDALGQSYSVFLSTALGTMGALTNTFIGMAGMDEEQRKKFLKDRLKLDDKGNITEDTILQVALDGVMRSSVFAMPSLLASTAGVNTGIKTTSTGYDYHKDDKLYSGFNLGKHLLDLAPAASTIKTFVDTVGFGINSYQMASDPYSFTDIQREKNQEKFAKSLRSMTNIPFLKWGAYNLTRPD